MKSILEELYYGEIDPNTTHFKDNSAIEIISENEEKLIKLLDEPEKSMFMDYSLAQSEITGLTAITKFITGFKLGALLMIDVFSDD